MTHFSICGMVKNVDFEEIDWKLWKKFQVIRNFLNIVTTFLLNFKSLLMRVSGISITINIFIKNLLELWKYLEKYGENLDIEFCRNKFQNEENLKKIPCQSWRHFGVTSANFTLNLKNYEEILKKCEDSLLPVKS